MTASAPADVPAGVGEPTPAAAASPLPAAGPRGLGALAGRAGRAGRPRRARRSRPVDLLGLLPFAAYVAVFLGAPAYAVITAAFKDDSGNPTLSNVTTTLKDPYRHAFTVSIELSVFSAVLGAVLGLALAVAVSGARRDGFVHRAVTTGSGVLAYFGGLPLAFVFLATLGPQGLVTKWLNSAGYNLTQHGFVLWNMAGLVLVYLYFQIPLMLLVIFPALDGLRPQWEEAARSLGASRLQYWLRVGGPLLAPPFLGALLLLFANAFAAYATAYALSTGSVPLVPIQIGSVMSGNVLAGQENIGNALGLWMIVVVGLVVVAYTLLQRRTARWLR
ncbi:putative spermidine/putrescine transport system permease protein [Catenulispora sp. GP43]|uniref:ABC transporter permease n=1 Tax=Catenulispora sp. GP43 TaxID=3156263 RepID=UPI0035148795